MLWLMLLSFILAYNWVGDIGANATCLASLMIFLFIGISLRLVLYALGVQIA